jgi:isochorismate synthase EntC
MWLTSNRLLRKLAIRIEDMTKALDDLTAQVKANTSLEASATAAIQGLATQIKDALANDDTAALQQLSTDLSASADALAKAIPASTPASAAAPTA